MITILKNLTNIATVLIEINTIMVLVLVAIFAISSHLSKVLRGIEMVGCKMTTTMKYAMNIQEQATIQKSNTS